MSTLDCTRAPYPDTSRHCVNSSIFFAAFLKESWLSTENKVRLLEWKVRLDLAMYASRKCPGLRLEEIKGYKPKHPSGWDEIMDRVCNFHDDGHSAKLIRALAHGQKICQPYEDSDAFRIKHDDWLQMGHMAIDSVENTARFDIANWVRSAGFEEAWEKVKLSLSMPFNMNTNETFRYLCEHSCRLKVRDVVNKYHSCLQFRQSTSQDFLRVFPNLDTA